MLCCACGRHGPLADRLLRDISYKVDVVLRESSADLHRRALVARNHPTNPERYPRFALVPAQQLVPIEASGAEFPVEQREFSMFPHGVVLATG